MYCDGIILLEGKKSTVVQLDRLWQTNCTYTVSVEEIRTISSDEKIM